MSRIRKDLNKIAVFTAPIDTGLTRKNIKTKKKGKGYVIDYGNTPYVIDLEEGNTHGVHKGFVSINTVGAVLEYIKSLNAEDSKSRSKKKGFRVGASDSKSVRNTKGFKGKRWNKCMI